MRKSDPITVVEACYSFEGDESQWLQRVIETMNDLMRPECGMLGYHIQTEPDGIRFVNPVQYGTTEALEALNRSARLLERGKGPSAHRLDRWKSELFTGVMRRLLVTAPKTLMASQWAKYAPRWTYTLGLRGVRDVMFLVSSHIDGHGATMVAAGLAQKRAATPSEHAMYQMLSAHIKAGLRLRRNLLAGASSMEAPVGGAVLDAGGRVIHADGEATEADARERLQEMARRVDTARTNAAGRDVRALLCWQGLVDGRWSMVERFDTDSRRYLVAHRNTECAPDPRGLTSMETRCCGLAVRGYSDKLVGYHLGVSEGTVSSHLSRAMRKLHLAGRVDLVRTLGSHFASASQELEPADEPSTSASDPLPMPRGTTHAKLSSELELLRVPIPEPQLDPSLTLAEAEIARRIYQGRTNREIAKERGVSVKTVGTQVESIFRKLSVSSRAELVLALQSPPAPREPPA